MGILYGYKKTLNYLIGIATGFFIVLLLSGWVSSFLLDKFPAFEGILRILGALYILWLAWGTLRASYSFEKKDHPPFGFPKGLVLQILNPKGIIFGLTIYSTFLAGKLNSFFALLISAVIFSGLAFTSVSLWTLFGAGIRKYLGKPRIKQIINIILALLLVYSALKLSGILELFN
jgi:cysteine/O-acetylserine efflux protein